MDSDYDLLKFLREGKELCGISVNDSLDEITEKLGAPEVQGTEYHGFLQYENGLRAGYVENRLDSICLYLVGCHDIKFEIHHDLNDPTFISHQTKIHQFMEMLNDHDIKWTKGDHDYGSSYFSLKTSANVEVTFELYEGDLHRICVKVEGSS